MHVLTEAGVLIHRAYDFLAALLDETLHGDANWPYLLSCSYIERAQVSGKTFGAPFSIMAGSTVSLCGVPPLASAKKMFVGIEELVHRLSVPREIRPFRVARHNRNQTGRNNARDSARGTALPRRAPTQ
jgi:hypothetical protein